MGTVCFGPVLYFSAMESTLTAELFLLIVAQFALVLALITLTIAMIAVHLSVFIGVPFVPTPSRFAGTIAELLDIAPGDTVYDLGSGDGRLLIALAARHPGARFIGVEANWFLITVARWRASRANVLNLSFRRENVYRSNFSDATKIYVYMLSTVLRRLEPVFESSPRLERVVSRAFLLPRTPAATTVEIDSLRTHGEHLVRLYLFKR
jgi:hypothetical protein